MNKDQAAYIARLDPLADETETLRDDLAAVGAGTATAEQERSVDLWWACRGEKVRAEDALNEGERNA